MKRVFWWAGIYGIASLLPNYFLEGRFGVALPPAITHPEFYYGFTGIGLAWQIAFLIIAKDPVRYRAFIIPSILEKLTFSAAVVVLWAQSRVPLLFVAAGGVDLTLAGLFFMVYRRTGTLPSLDSSNA